MGLEQKDLDLVAAAGRLLEARHWMLAMAESCTGGLIGHLITSVPGSSAYFAGGIVSYENRAKEQLLDVTETDLIAYGAVSEAVARQMARGAREALGAQVAVSTTGIAGPTGGLPDKPVGTVYIGISSPGVEWVEHHVWPHDRQGNKLASARRAVEMVVELLSRG